MPPRDDAFINARPSFVIGGEERADLQEAITGMVINLPLTGCAHGELTLTNWGTPEGQQTPDFLFADIGLGSEVEIRMGDPQPATLFRGEVTAIEEQYGDGAPTLALLLQDRLHHLARARQNRSYEDQSPDDIVQAIASEAGLQADVQVSSITDTWHQLNESDLAFLLRLLGRFDIALRLEGNTLRARPEQPDPQPLALDAQDSALQVRLMVDLNHQPLSSTSQGYNLGTDAAVEHRSEALSPAPAGTGAADTLAQLGWPGEEVVPHPFPRSQGEADAYAGAHFHRQAKRFVQGELVCQGEPGLKSGREIELSGVSPRLRGTYQVVHCSHRFDNQSGFETHLKVNKADWSPNP
ncbi:MAG: phage late control D family protein [Pseudomonadota bacterium]|nr:phage late control D family protein [Pseudomonadota bacterium]